MKLLIVRHAKAEDRDDFSKRTKSDAERPLTSEGKKEFRKICRVLKKLAPKVDLVITSPYTRAKETGEILCDVLKVKAIEMEALQPPMKNDILLEWLDESSEKYECVAIVGHEPDLGKFVSYTLTGERMTFAPMKKGGVAYVKFDYRVRPGLGQLRWFLPPSIILDSPATAANTL